MGVLSVQKCSLLILSIVAGVFVVSAPSVFAQTESATSSQDVVVYSPVFSDSSMWYQKMDATFMWTLPEEANVVAVDIATSSSAEPLTVVRPFGETYTVPAEDLAEGIQYFVVQFKENGVWGEIFSKKVQIDNTPPLPFGVQVQGCSLDARFPVLLFETTDELSGIDHYTVEVSLQDPITVSVEQAKEGYTLSALEDGTHTVVVSAYDKAGNVTRQRTSVLVSAGWKDPSSPQEPFSLWELYTPQNMFFGFLFFVIVCLLAFVLHTQAMARTREKQLREETLEIQDQMGKIFSALRDEITDQILAITARKKLSKKEKEAVDSLHQSLKVSQTLMDKEVRDVKKMLK